MVNLRRPIKKITVFDFGNPSDVLAMDEYAFRKMGDKKGANIIIRLGKRQHIPRTYPPSLVELQRAKGLPQLYGKDYVRTRKVKYRY